MRATSLISTSVLSGLEGVSIMMTETRPLPSAVAAAARTLASSTPSAKPTAAMSKAVSVRDTSVSVPP